jgi:hypothetical protein
MPIDKSMIVELTATGVEVVIVPEVALILAVPIAEPVTRPPALTGATEDVSEAQVTDPVRFWVEPSV